MRLFCFLLNFFSFYSVLSLLIVNILLLSLSIVYSRILMHCMLHLFLFFTLFVHPVYFLHILITLKSLNESKVILFHSYFHIALYLLYLV